MQAQFRMDATVAILIALRSLPGLNPARMRATPILGWLLALVVFGAFAVVSAQAAVAEPLVSPSLPKNMIFDYALAPGDLISVVVFGEPELSKDYTVGESGKIAFPLIGEVTVLSLKTKQVERLLRKRLKSGFLVNPRVNVTIRTYRSVYINGQVKTPSGYPFVPGMTVRKLISIAGGFTERASTSRIYVISEVAGASTSPRKVKIDAEVRPGDIISVEESFF